MSFHEGEAERLQELEDGGVCRGLLSSGHDVVIVLKLTTATVTHTGLTKAHVSITPSPLTEQLLAIDSCWGRGIHSLLRMWPPMGSPGSRGWPQMHAARTGLSGLSITKKCVIGKGPWGKGMKSNWKQQKDDPTIFHVYTYKDFKNNENKENRIIFERTPHLQQT